MLSDPVHVEEHPFRILLLTSRDVRMVGLQRKFEEEPLV